MPDSEIRERVEAYIDSAIAKSDSKVPPEAREAAIERIEAWTRELLAALERIARKDRQEPGPPIGGQG